MMPRSVRRPTYWPTDHACAGNAPATDFLRRKDFESEDNMLKFWVGAGAQLSALEGK